MKGLSDLRVILSLFFTWDKRHLTTLVLLITGLVKGRHVNLKRVAALSVSKARADSRYRRFQRFFSKVNFNYELIARCIFSLFSLHEKKYYLTIDRTNWQWGKRTINIFWRRS